MDFRMLNSEDPSYHPTSAERPSNVSVMRRILQDAQALTDANLQGPCTAVSPTLRTNLSQKAPVGLVLDLILLLKSIRIQDHIFIA